MTAATLFDGYDRTTLHPTVAHIGPGVFHRAHQAVYCDAVLRTGSRNGAVWGIALRSSAVRDALEAKSFVYEVVEVTSGQGGTEDVTALVQPVGALLGINVVSQDVEAALTRLVDDAITVVTITVTENGYCAANPGGPLDTILPDIVHDLVTPMTPRSLPGLLLEALVRRRAAGTAPFTIVSCDNLPQNGVATARVVCELAECRDPSLAAWVQGNVAFPSSMVDRMVPATSDADPAMLRRLGLVDGWPVVTEPFSQWVLEDMFPTGRPEWERVGVELVGDVATHERAKLRILNAAHSALAYWGLLAGHRFIWQAATDHVLLDATRDFLVNEVMPTLEPPPGWNLDAYTEQVLSRFANRALPYTTKKVACDGSQKLAVRVVPTVRDRLADGMPAPRSAQLLAAWIASVAGPRAAVLAVDDSALASGPAGALTRSAHNGTVSGEHAAAALLALPGFFDTSDPTEHAFADEVARQARLLWRTDVRLLLGASLDGSDGRHAPSTSLREWN
ncbi:MAG: mannitol dehydrogenase family protein [Acidimicrobiales bacterium]